MGNIWKTFVLLVLLPTVISFAQATSLNNCNAKLVKEDMINKLEGVTHYKTDIIVKFDDFNVKSNVVGKKYADSKSAKMKIKQKIKTTEYALNYLTVFDGEFQWVESRRDDFMQVVKLKISSLTQHDRPFDTGYYLMGTGLLNGEDYVGTFINLLNFYDLDAVCTSRTIILSGVINKEKFSHYALNTKTKKSNNEYISKYIKEFGHLSLEIDKKNLTVNSYKIGHSSKGAIFEALFSDTDLKADIDDKVFLYTPPSGVKVLDITAEVKNNEH